MAFKERLAKQLEITANNFFNPDKKKLLLDSLKSGTKEWRAWKSKVLGLLKNLNEIDALKFKGLLFLAEQNPESESRIKNLEEFLMERVEFYKSFDFKKQEKEISEGRSRTTLVIEKFFRILISRSFLGILILAAALSFILWFYLDRPAAIEFTSKILNFFLKVVD